MNSKLPDEATLDELQRQVDIYHAQLKLKYSRAGLKPKPADEKPPIQQTINCKIYTPLYDALRAISDKTGISQRRIVEDALVEYIQKLDARYGGPVREFKG